METYGEILVTSWAAKPNTEVALFDSSLCFPKIGSNAGRRVSAAILMTRSQTDCIWPRKDFIVALKVLSVRREESATVFIEMGEDPYLIIVLTNSLLVWDFMKVDCDELNEYLLSEID